MNLSKKSSRMQQNPFSASEHSLWQSKLPKWRSGFILFLFFVGFLILALRGLWVQVINHQFYSNQGEKRYLRTLSLRPSRGKIVDRNSSLLAVSLASYEIWASPDKVKPAQFPKIAQLLNMPVADVRQRIESGKTFVLLKRQVSPEVADQINLAKISGLTQIEDSKRFYPEGESAAHVVGFTNSEDKGQEGIELIANQALSGTAGQRRFIRDRLGQIVYDKDPIIHPTHGEVIKLTIDRRIQQLAYTQLKETVLEHKAQAGSVVVLDAQTGEILALTNYPSFDPNDRRNLSGQQLRNRAAVDTFEPGSTIKPLIVALALDQGIVNKNSLINTAPGTYTIGRSTIHDTSNHGIITVEQGLQKSSNIMLVKLTQQLDPKTVWEKYYQYGLGQNPTIEFPGIASGRLRPYQNWRPIEQATMSYGYGLSMSLLQLAQMYTAYAGDGSLHPIYLVKPETDGFEQSSKKQTPITKEQTAADIRKMLELAVNSEGTGRLAQVDGYRIGGKSGTVRKQIGKGYSKEKYRALFVGMAPMSKPRLIIAVMIDEPSQGKYYGGTVAAPVFSKIMQGSLTLLGIPPDNTPLPQNISD